MIGSLIQKLKAFDTDDEFREILHGGIYSFIAKILGRALGLVSSIIIARYYGATIIGYVSIITTVLGLTTLISNAGMSVSILKLIPEYSGKFSEKSAFKIYYKMFVTTVAIAMVTGSILYVFSKEISNNIFQHKELEVFFMISAAMVSIFAIYSLNMSAIRAMKQVRMQAVFEFLPNVISIILLLIMTFVFYDKFNPIYILFATTTITVTLTSVYISRLEKKKPTDGSIDTSPSYLHILTLSFPMFLTVGLQYVMASSDIIMLGIFTSADQIGIYAVALTLSTLTTFILMSINTIAAPKFSELYHDGKTKELRYVAQKSTRVILWATLPIFMILLVFGQMILSVYGDDFTSGYVALVFLLIGQLVNSITGPVGTFLNMTGHQVAFRNIVLIAAILNVALNYILIPGFGINGAAFANMIGIVSVNVMAALFQIKTFGFTTIYVPGNVRSIIKSSDVSS